MNNTNFQNEILSLIREKIEGPYWDFKRSWHTKDVDLLHDIICMANNLVSHDGYIIIGIDENNDFAPYSCKDDECKKNNNELVTFLRSKPFWGGLRPIVLVRTFYIDSDEINVLIIKNSMNTPFVLSENYPKDKNGKQLFAHHVYTRINDSNTPKNASADIDKVEYLWRKRFGIGMSVLEKLKIYLSKTNDWIYNDELSFFYYKYDPLYTIKIDREQDDLNRSAFYNKLFIDSEGFQWQNYDIIYNTTVLFSWVCSFNDGGRELRNMPQAGYTHMDNFPLPYYYFVKGELDYYIDEIFKYHYNKYDRPMLFEEFLIYFENEEEQTQFDKFFKKNITSILENNAFPAHVINESFNLSDHENNEYINAKKFKWIYENKFLEKKNE